MVSQAIDDIRAEALFVTDLQRSEHPTADQVRAAIQQALLRHGGGRNCAALVAAEFGEHPETAVTRMRWALDVVHEAYSSQDINGLDSTHQTVPAGFGAA